MKWLRTMWDVIQISRVTVPPAPRRRGMPSCPINGHVWSCYNCAECAIFWDSAAGTILINEWNDVPVSAELRQVAQRNAARRSDRYYRGK